MTTTDIPPTDIEYLDFPTPGIPAGAESRIETIEKAYVAHGLGVIATGEGGRRGSYVQAQSIEAYIPPKESYAGISSELLQYRRLNRNWAAAVALRTKWHEQQAALPDNIVLGEN